MKSNDLSHLQKICNVKKSVTASSKHTVSRRLSAVDGQIQELDKTVFHIGGSTEARYAVLWHVWKQKERARLLTQKSQLTAEFRKLSIELARQTGRLEVVETLIREDYRRKRTKGL